MSDITPTRPCGRLRADFIDKVRTGEVEFPKRNTSNKLTRIDAHLQSAMLAGNVLDWYHFEDLLKKLRRHKPSQVHGYKLEDVAEPHEGPPADMTMPDLMLKGWSDIKKFLESAPAIHNDSFCDKDRRTDFEAMANLILDSLGYLHYSTKGEPKKATPEAARSKGEELSGFAYPGWVDWLQNLCAADIRTVMFAVGNVPHDGKHQYVPLGSVIVLPLKEAAWHRFRAGEIGYSRITADDIQRPSTHVVMHSFSEVRPSFCDYSKRISLTLTRTVMYQLATLCPEFRALRPKTWPHVLCLAPLHLHQHRAPGFGLTPIENSLEPDTKSRIWELGTFGFGALIATLSYFQWVHRNEVVELPAEGPVTG